MAQDEPFYILLSNTSGPSTWKVDSYGSVQGATIARSISVLSEANDRGEKFRYQPSQHLVLPYKAHPGTGALPPAAQFDLVDRKPHVHSCFQTSEEQKSRHPMLSTYRKLHTLCYSSLSISRFRLDLVHLGNLLSPCLRICLLSRNIVGISHSLRR